MLLPFTKYSRLIRPIVSTTSIPQLPRFVSEAGSESVTSKGGQFCAPIYPQPGSILHAEEHSGYTVSERRTAIVGSWLYCSKDSHSYAFARSYLSAGNNAVPSAKCRRT